MDCLEIWAGKIHFTPMGDQYLALKTLICSDHISTKRFSVLHGLFQDLRCSSFAGL